MSDVATKEQPEVAAAAQETQTAQETAPSAPATETAEAKETTEPQNGAAAAETKDEKASEQKPQTGRKEFKKNKKFDPTTMPVTDDPVKIRAQVEFYFSDSNLPIDKFMWESTGGEANKPMPLKTICSFKRMRQFQPYSAVVAALRESNFLEISGPEGEEVVKRKVPYKSSTEAQKRRLESSVYVKGFGEEEPSTQFDIEAFFAPYGPIKMVKLRRTADDTFKGSVFVEFESPELADAFVKLDPKPTWKDSKEPLIVMKKIDYLEEKNRQIKEGIIQPSTSRKPTFFEGRERGPRGRGRGRGGRNGNDRNSNDKKNSDDQKNGHKNGRGRGRGRGGRGGRGGSRDSHEKREQKKEETRPSTNDVQIPTIQSTAPKNGEANGKRAREDDNAEAPPAKKVDTKAEAPAVSA